MKIVCKLSEDELEVEESKIINLNSKKAFKYTFWKQNNTYAEFYKDEAIDMLYLSLAVFAVDRLILRETGEDAWSRKIELYMPVLCVDKWNVCQLSVEEMLNFLTGDKWKIYFRERELTEIEKEAKKKWEKVTVKNANISKICMFSGGLDSCIGALNLLCDKKDASDMLFVSHYGGGKGTVEYQGCYFSINHQMLQSVNGRNIVGNIPVDKIYDVTSQVQETMTQMEQAPDKAQKAIDKLKEVVKQSAVKAVVDTAQSTYGSDMKAVDKRQIESKLNHEADRMIDKLHTNYEIERNVIENQRVAEQQARYETGKTSEQIDKEFEQKQKAAMEKFNEELTIAISDFAKESTKETVKTIETKKKEREKETIEDGVRDHLRGFSRTIPSFLMAYGDNTVTLATFDTIIPDKVFLEVTSITLDQFKFLRDGGDYIEEETGQTKHFDGQLFDSVVFDDSVKEFLALKKKLADYFDEKSVEDIFDYIPPQKTNQIFTPKTMVKKMVDMLEQENPGCFDMPDKTFIDLYMKSGLYITEIVKRLYQSDEMKKQFPDNKERLKHIFEKQVYGLAPTEIIYKIATSYILGFDEDTKDIKHNFRQLDALPYAKEGTLEQVLDELYPEQQ